MEQVEIVLRRASDDPQVKSLEFQKELREFSQSMHDARVTFSQRAIAFDSVDALGYPLAEFVLKSLGPAAIAAVAAISGAWVQARYGRKVRLKIGDVEAEGRTIEEIQNLLKQATDFRDADHKKGGDT